jgi:hypothetical protein
MSSGYDDRFDDAPEHDRDGELPSSRDVIAIAKSRVRGPAIALMITGIGTILVAILATVNMFTLDQQFDQVEAQWDNDPNLNAQQRQDMKKMLADAKPVVKSTLPVAIVVWIITGLLTTVGSIKMMKLSGSGLAKLGAILSMLPIFSWCCCFLGVPVGIWAFIVLSNPAVKDGFSAVKRSASGMDGNY